MKKIEMTQEIAEQIAASKFINYGTVSFYWGDVFGAGDTVSRRVIVRGIDCYDGICEVVAPAIYYC